MPRQRFTDPIAFQRENLAERRFSYETQNEADKLTLAQESNLLHKAQMVFEVVKARQAIEDKRDQTMHAAAIIQKMGGLNINDPQYEVKRADILSQHAAGLGIADNYVKQKDSVWEAQQKANQTKAEAFAPANVGKAAYDLNAAIHGLDSLAQQFTRKNQPVPVELQNAKTNFTKLAEQIGQKALDYTQPAQPNAAVQDLANAPAATAALKASSAQPVAQPAAPGAPAPSAAPTATPAATPITIATDDATKFLNSIGVGAPAAQQPAAQPVQAASSGLPDTANAAVDSSDDGTD